MNSLSVEKLTYHFQDLVAQKKIKTFTKFYDEIIIFFEILNGAYVTLKFIYKELKNIHAFLKIIQYHPNSFLLTQALKPLFKFLLNNLIVPKVVYVADKKFFSVCKIKYRDLIAASREKRIFQVEGDMFVIPYKGKVSKELREAEGFPPRTNWVIDFVSHKIMRKISLSQIRYGVEILNPDGWSIEQNFEFGLRLAKDYFNSDSEYLPRELFDLAEAH